jgi:HlyD family secretion protein
MKQRATFVRLTKRQIATAPMLLLMAACGRRDSGKGPLELAGTLESRDIRVGSLVGGRVAKVLVDEGDRVVPGQPLVELERDLPGLQVEEQRARVAQAEARLQLAQVGPRTEEVERARLDWKQAENDRVRFEQLAKEGVADRQRAEASATLARTRLQSLRELERGNRAEDIAQAQAALEGEKQHLAWLERQLEETIVKAPVAGRIEALDLRPGDLVAADQAAATLLEDDQLWVRLYVPETKLGRVSVGQRVTLKVDTFPDKSFPGRVVSIRGEAEYTPRNVQTLESRSDQVFALRVEPDPAPELRPGMSVVATLEEPAK